MSFKVIVTRDFDQMSEIGAGIVVRHIRKTLADKERYVLGLATGNSPTGLYKRLAAAAGAGEFPARKITSFNLDEYIGLPGANAQQRALHPESYSYFMIQELFGLLKEKFRETFVPWGTLIDQERLEKELAAHPGDWEGQGTDKGKAVVVRPDAASDYLRWIRSEILAAYEEEIKAAGGIDLHIIGVGGRGHVAFHEAGIPFAGNRMLLVQLDDNTIDNAVADGHFERR
ncbi:MAG TPA: 6-phosphogluconolactonase, partial [Syntrophales bacterium]|nr:6-phosphogluconolactonase [Syntrophales bacterium]